MYFASRRCDRFTGLTRKRSNTPWERSLMMETDSVVEASRPATDADHQGGERAQGHAPEVRGQEVQQDRQQRQPDEDRIAMTPSGRSR